MHVIKKQIVLSSAFFPLSGQRDWSNFETETERVCEYQWLLQLMELNLSCVTSQCDYWGFTTLSGSLHMLLALRPKVTGQEFLRKQHVSKDLTDLEDLPVFIYVS